ncbi:putative cytoplasmic protein [Salmonella enterica subsp. enterica]|uniref:Putative cytoplasmic protein n=1 Tax=Salmonella enterica I TaxID=59201 RepID=A0A447MTG4_SALET|nr:putative cytoplasmic protein [Salmonella enterica subsp. enterica]
MTIEECTIYITQDNNSATWQRWEAGDIPISPEIIARLKEMKARRQRRINAIVDKINNRIGNNTMRYFPDLSSFQSIYTEGDLSSGKFINLLLPNFSHMIWSGCVRRKLYRRIVLIPDRKPHNHDIDLSPYPICFLPVYTTVTFRRHL